MKYRYISKNIIVFLCIVFSSCASLSDSAIYFHQAKHEAKRKNYDSAFMKLRAFLVDEPYSPYAGKAAFAIGEYYFDKNDYTDATIAFYNYIKNYPNDPGVIFAEFIIYKMHAEIKTDKENSSNDPRLIEDKIKKKIFSKPLFFIFSDKKKSFSYRSIFLTTYTAFDYVDKVRVIRNGELFLEVSP